MSRTDKPSPATDLSPAMPRVDVIMPVYNGEAYLPEQVRSILDQTHVSVRLTVLDDCSSDGSLALLKRIASEDHRVTVLNNTANLGLNRSLSRLLREVRADYFALADQDDIWCHDKLARSIATLRQERAALVYSDVRLIDAAGRRLTDSYLRPKGMRPIVGSDPVPFIFRNPAIGHTMVGTAGLAAAARDIEPSLLAHEIWIIAAACRMGKIAFLDRPLGSYRQHANNVIGARRTALQRLARLFGPNGTLWRRQQTRIRAIAALAPLHPSLAPIARIETRSGPRKLLGLPRFCLFMLGLAPRIGLLAACTEIVLFPFGGVQASQTRGRPA